jgi:hypothetical protein
MTRRTTQRGLAVRRGLPVRPVTGGHAEARDPVNVEAALGAVVTMVERVALSSTEEGMA